MGDKVVDVRSGEVWGKINGENLKVWLLDNGRIVKKSNEGRVWIVQNLEGVSKEEISKEVSRQNAILNVEKPLTQYNIYSVYWINPNPLFKPARYDMWATFKLVVSARNDQEAFDFIQTIKLAANHNTHQFWSDKSQLVFHLIGKSNLNSTSLICNDSQQDTG
jgi:hypothetical protein